MRVAAVQLLVDDETAREERRARVRQIVLAEAGRGADLVLLPELWLAGFFAFDRYHEVAEELTGNTATWLAELAAEASVHLCAGTIVERDGDRLYNTLLLFDRSGTRTAHYRKIHLFGYGRSREPELVTPGDEILVCAIDGVTCGLSTCYDLRFPEQYRAMVDRGAEVLLLVAAWPFPRVEAWRCLTQARAIENQAAVVACNAAGRQGGHVYSGGSCGYNEWGMPLGQLDARPGVLRVDIDVAEISSARADYPALSDRVGQLR